MKFRICKFNELTVMEMYEIARSRFEVFAMEQKIIQEPELDGIDNECYQVFYMDNNRVVAYCRIVPAGVAYNNISLGRVLVLNDYRRKGLALIMIKEALKFIKEELHDFKFKTPDGTYLAWIDARDVPYTAEEIQDALVNVGGIGIMKGEIYGGPKYLRMNIGCPQSKLKEGLRRFKIAMDALYSK